LLIEKKEKELFNIFPSIKILTTSFFLCFFFLQSVIEVNVSELGLVTPGGKVVWGKYAQVTNNPENDGCINAVLLV
jgi:hypothetical protein